MKQKPPFSTLPLCSPLFHSFILVFLLRTRTASCSVEPKFQACEPKTCGNNQSISYPFYIEGTQKPFCGYPGFGLTCANNGFPVLNLSNTQYIVHEIFYDNESLRVSNAAFSRSNNTKNCAPRTQNLTIPFNRFQIASNQKELILFFGCDLTSMPRWMIENRIGCSAENETSSVVALYREDQNLSLAMKNCEGGVVDAVVEDGNGGIPEALRRGLLLNWTASDCSLCRNSGGRCGFEADIYTFRCYCTDRVHASKCDPTPECPPSFDCGYLGNISFPFTTTERQDCGLMGIQNCHDTNKTKRIQLQDPGEWFEVILVTQFPRSPYSTIHIRDRELYGLVESKSCRVFSDNYTVPPGFPFVSFRIYYNATLFRCNRTLHVSPPPYVHNYTRCPDYDLYYYYNFIPDKSSTLSSLTACSKVQLPIKDVPDAKDPFTFLTADIFIKVQLSDECAKCHYGRRGECQLDGQQKFCCVNATEGKQSRFKVKLGIGLGIGLPSILIIVLLLLLYKRKHATSGIQFQSRNSYSDSSLNRHLEGAYFGIPVFSYEELKEATNNFDHTKELGDGGFGTVYHGKLQDGREVAVKRLYEHNYRRVEQFMNEVEILTRLRHRNLVSLYGCTSRHSRELLLVYEYISNGTVAFHLHGQLPKPGLLPWSIRIKIAIETASALAYLHASDIIHRDVKTNNILLDNSYCVKVADFGLSRLFPNDVTHVSTAPQGTPGYVDPAYHRCYQLTSKSDVYSFGVVLIELISSKPAVDMNRDEDEINLSDLAVKKIQEGALGELVDPSLGFDLDNEVKRMIVSVAELAFQCLQREKELRPSMDEVLEELKRIESGKDETRHLEVDGGGVSPSNVDDAPPPPTSTEWDEVGLLKNMKVPPSPIAVIDKWESKCTTPNVSG